MVLAEDLRQAVLQAALQGKLTEQLETDSNVDEMLISIREEKEKFIAGNKIKKEKPLSEIQDGEISFVIPDNWKFVKLGEIALYLDAGKSPDCIKENVKGNEWGVITTTAIQINNFLENENKRLPDDFEINKDLKVQVDDILITRAGPMSRTGIMCLVENIKYNLLLSDKTVRVNINNKYIDKRFITNAVNAPHIRIQIVNMMSGMDKQQVNISQEKIRNIIIPLPPIEEQQRIVDIINKIMPKIDEYEEIEKELEALKKEFPDNMKDALLQAAMQGKLTEQLESDSSVDELLESIRKEKEELIAQKKIRKEKSLPDIEEEEIPFDIPESWRWVRLKNVCTRIVDGDHNPPRGTLEKTEYLMLSAQNINSDKLVNLEQVRYLTKEIFEQENLRTQVQIDDIFFTIVGTLGRSCIYTGGYNISFQRSVAVISTRIYNRYLKCVLDSPYIQRYMVTKATGTAQKGFYLNQVDNLLIPIPSIEEQRRIVERLDVLLPLCEDLKEN